MGSLSIQASLCPSTSACWIKNPRWRIWSPSTPSSTTLSSGSSQCPYALAFTCTSTHLLYLITASLTSMFTYILTSLPSHLHFHLHLYIFTLTLSPQFLPPPIHPPLHLHFRPMFLSWPRSPLPHFYISIFSSTFALSYQIHKSYQQFVIPNRHGGSDLIAAQYAKIC